ncbi:hypothetical protein J2N86_01935 [Legionella lytica]|uniref:UDP-N-acetylglucosamine kinase n=1 Tax=Legionella lytica TaxID=96232 RepID=A0ABY4Y9C8_9GAMM|nr:hypothetical protein [Legionella lytica]USQ14116.1 hypothetical protein J2N86_01935 [Legionella lytica]
MGIYGASKDDLFKQIGKYSAYPAESCLSKKGQEELCHGVQKYKNAHRSQVSAYKKEHNIVERADGLDDPLFFRKQLIEYIEKHPLPKFTPGIPDNRATDPESATIKMAALLGEEGVKLYKLALEEEMNSKEFRYAVAEASTTHYDGPKWKKERPVVIVAGPSGCGKSHAAQNAVKTANRFLPTDDQDMSGNNVIAADGGIVREVSQMRKLLVQVALNQGYTGIEDLHSKSKALEKTKHYVQAAGFATPDIGVVIPETFSKWLIPLNPVRSLMKRIDALVNTKQIFARVEGEDAETFKETVAFMGSRRAWKTKNFDEQVAIDLNISKDDICESKAYGANGFAAGKSGSKSAENWFNKYSKDKLSMVITNDLILLKPDPNNQKGPWLPAAKNDEGTQLISKSVYDKWLDIPEGPKKPAMLDYYKTHVKALIITSAQVDFAIAQKQIVKRLAVTEAKLEKEMNKENPNPDRVAQLINRQALLTEVANFNPRNLDNHEAIAHLKHKTQEAMDDLKVAKSSSRLSVSWSIKAFDKVLTSLEKVGQELQTHNPATETEQANCHNSRSLRCRLQSIKAELDGNEHGDIEEDRARIIATK